MKLSVGMMLIEKATRKRFQVTSFDSASVSIRHVEYRASLNGHGPMAWCIPWEEINSPPDEWLRPNLEVCFEPVP